MWYGGAHSLTGARKVDGLIETVKSLMENVSVHLMALFPWVWAVFFVAFSHLLANAMIGLHAKRRARDLLSRTEALGPEPRDLAIRLRGGPLTPAELDVVTRSVEEALKGRLPARQFRMIEQGLHQPNRIAERLFLTDLTGLVASPQKN
jgi:hypothetical protein